MFMYRGGYITRLYSYNSPFLGQCPWAAHHDGSVFALPTTVHVAWQQPLCTSGLATPPVQKPQLTLAPLWLTWLGYPEGHRGGLAFLWGEQKEVWERPGHKSGETRLH